MGQQSIDTTCCEETDLKDYNPKSDLRRTRRRTGIQLFELKNPIPAEITDDQGLTGVFNRLNLVPYAGSEKATGDTLLLWYLMLAKLSPSHGSCINKLVKYAVGGRAQFVRATDPEYDLGEEVQPLTEAEKVEYKDALKQFIEFEGGVKKFHRRAAWQCKATGNIFMELSYAETNGQIRAHLRVHRTTTVRYRRTKPEEMRVVLVSPVWTDEYTRKNPPRPVTMFPNFTEGEDGTRSTMFHHMEGDGNWYGRPNSEPADIYKYREVQDSLYLVRQAAANFVGQLIIEVEDDDPETAPALDEDGAVRAGFDSFSDRMDQNHTNKGEDPASILVTARPYGSRPMFVHQVAPNTNQAWYTDTGKIAADKIREAHSCTDRFLGREVANGFSTDVFMDDYVLYMEPVIAEFRDDVTDLTNRALTVVWGLVGREQLNDRSLTFEPPIATELVAYKARRTQQRERLAQPDPNDQERGPDNPIQLPRRPAPGNPGQP